MAKKLDQILVIDVESTCWEGKIPDGQESEIIEIGICIIDIAFLQILKRDSILVKPEKSKLSSFCVNFTELTQEIVDSGVSFSDACKILKKEYGARERLWASYGDYDRRQFERQCQSRKISYPFGPSHLNIKTLFAVKQKLSVEPSMDEALALLKLPLVGRHHCGIDDAYNISQILLKLLA